jgi:glycosyltransferase involved in cell wall biosynthesis
MGRRGPPHWRELKRGCRGRPPPAGVRGVPEKPFFFFFSLFAEGKKREKEEMFKGRPLEHRLNKGEKMYTHDINSAENITKSPATFVIPFYGDQERATKYLGETIESILAQSDQNFQIVIVDDASPKQADQEYLRNLEKTSPKITVLRQKVNRGQGICRNVAIEWAWKRHSPIILFNDADDISSRERLKVVRETFLEFPTVDVVYSNFKIIDEFGNLVPDNEIGPSILEIIEANDTNPVEGYNAWIKIGTVTGFACLPSSTAVRTSIAYACPSPEERVSEDSYLWLHIAAEGGELKYVKSIPSLYRIPTDKRDSTHRVRIGKTFYREKARVDTNGFLKAIDVALKKNTISPDEVNGLKAKFFRRLAETLEKEKELDLVEKYLKEAELCEAHEAEEAKHQIK